MAKQADDESKKRASKKKSRQISRQEELVRELKLLAKQIDEEGLLFLIQQANVMLYNKRVDQINKENQRITRKRKRSIPQADAAKKPRRSQGTDLLFDVEAAAMGKNYIFVFQEARSIFGQGELIKLVKVCQSTADKQEGAKRVYAWLERNRDDVLMDARLTAGDQPVFAAVYEFLKSNFTIKK